MNDKKKDQRIKTKNLPHQKGSLSDYWVAIFEDNIEGAETEQEAIQKILNKRKDLN
ncbi:hypothetical protein N5923_24355 [Erwiniaceae bacterium BAC15a-03b]|uniref:Uncharacterized protein n=1 Tax=Winslowiella arboricola TaxID=2978220 RepID=A0A9J6Q2Y9_9GAMM|nr:hypothetical protein [Winslowiella arboricola]MCU5772941.1 hypothetical protein [Winslowiella arboricola]MCU5780631.1 hypothetical protein [Winslowiella arboricola]